MPRITKLEKEVFMDKQECRITVEITVPKMEGYQGLDVFPDALIPDLLLAMSRKYRIKKGKLKVCSIIK